MAFIFLFGDLLNWADWIMAVARRVIDLGFAKEDVVELMRVARSRTEPASRVERAPMLVAYRETSFFARHVAEVVFDRRRGF